jgi:hypothetical protein
MAMENKDLFEKVMGFAGDGKGQGQLLSREI